MAEDAYLKSGVIWNPKGTTKFKGHPEGPRGLDHRSMFSDQTDLGRWNASGFQVMGQPAYGARTGWSNRHQQCRIHLVLRE